MNSKRVVKAAEALLQAEYQFRLGKKAYHDEPTDWFVKAERKLRRALTGKSDLRKAYRVLRRREREET